MKARYFVTKDIGKKTTEEHGELDIKDFPPTNKQGVSAEVEMQVGFARGYGEVKVSAKVTAQCAQDNEHVRELGASLHMLAYELAMNGFNMVCSDLDAAERAKK